jgi:N-acyl-D-amino-acid deacylase
MRFHFPAAVPVLLTAVTCAAQIPVRGVPVPELSWLDSEMTQLMEDNDISGGLLGIMRNGVIIYQRGFGWHDEARTIGMPENALVRVASCSKPYTAAAIRRLEALGVLDINEFAFDLGQVGGGILPHDPWPSLGDSRLRDVRVWHLYTHRGGWDRNQVGDLTTEECQIAGDFGVASPPGRDLTMRWILGQPLQFDPGTLGCMDGDGNPAYCYSNIGYLALGLIAEQRSGVGLVDYLRGNILTPDMWVPWTDLRQARTFRSDQPAREAWYDDGQDWCVFQGRCTVLRCAQLVDAPYGSQDIEARIANGGLLVSTATMLRFMDRYVVAAGSQNIGLPRSPTSSGGHSGAQPGVSCLARQRSDGINVFVWFNRRNGDEEGPSFSSALYDAIAGGLTNQTNWPSLGVDGFWLKPDATPTPEVHGSYDRPFESMTDALSQLGHGSRLNLKPGTHAFTGTINTKLQIRAPQGLARLGTN